MRFLISVIDFKEANLPEVGDGEYGDCNRAKIHDAI